MVLECSLCVVYWNHFDDCVCCGVSWLYLFGCEHQCKWWTENSFIHIRLLINMSTERIMYSERHAEYNKLCGRPQDPQYAPAPASSPLTFLSWKWCSSHVQRGQTLCQFYSSYGLSVLDLGPVYAADRQTDVRRVSSLNTSALWGRVIIMWTVPKNAVDNNACSLRLRIL